MQGSISVAFSWWGCGHGSPVFQRKTFSCISKLSILFCCLFQPNTIWGKKNWQLCKYHWGGGGFMVNSIKQIMDDLVRTWTVLHSVNQRNGSNKLVNSVSLGEGMGIIQASLVPGPSIASDFTHFCWKRGYFCCKLWFTFLNRDQ